jgi:hypothetical protein
MTTIIKMMPRTLMPPMTIAIAAEAATEPTEQRDDQDDDVREPGNFSAANARAVRKSGATVIVWHHNRTGAPPIYS